MIGRTKGRYEGLVSSAFFPGVKLAGGGTTRIVSGSRGVNTPAKAVGSAAWRTVTKYKK